MCSWHFKLTKIFEGNVSIGLVKLEYVELSIDESHPIESLPDEFE